MTCAVADEGKQAESKPDDTVPSPERQSELENAYQGNLAAGNPPYQGVPIMTLGELQWVMKTWDWSDELGTLRHLPSANLSGADLGDVNLARAELRGANLSGADLGLSDLTGADLSWANLSNADLPMTNLSNAQLESANLSGANLGLANLSGANLGATDLSDEPWSTNLSGATLWSANLVGANLRFANLSGANLRSANLSGANLLNADLSGANLLEANLSGVNLRGCRLDVTTQLFESTFDSAMCLADVVWNAAPLTRVAWEAIPTLGDETAARRGTDNDGKRKDGMTRSNEYAAAVRAYRQLAVALRSQGLNDHADNYAYHAQLMQRDVFRWKKQWGGYLFSWLLFLISGYGYRLRRILLTYAAVVLGFTFIYWALGVHSFPHESDIQALWDSFLVSLSAIHGRTTFEQLGAWSPAAWTAAVESVCGIVIEGVFVAMLIQRFFAR